MTTKHQSSLLLKKEKDLLRQQSSPPAASYKTQRYWEQYQPFFPAWARVADANAPEEEWFSWRGAAIHVDRFAARMAPSLAPAPAPAAAALTVILVHGGGGYGRMLAPLGRFLQTAGYEVIAPDLPGYGLSRADAALTSYAAWVEALCDLAATEYRHHGRRVVFFGGSLGGYLAYLCAARLGSELVAGVIATTLADPRSPLVRRQFSRNALVLHMLMPLMPCFAALAGGLKLPVKWFTKMHAMSNNRTLNRLIANDPLGGNVRVPVRFMQSIFTIRPAIEPEDFAVCPVLLAHPADDRWTGIASSRSFFDRIKGNKTLTMLENCGHFPVEEPGITQLQEAALAFLSTICEEEST